MAFKYAVKRAMLTFYNSLLRFYIKHPTVHCIFEKVNLEPNIT